MFIKRSGKKINFNDFEKIAKYSICQIEYNIKNNINEKVIFFGTGFLVKLPIPMMNEPLYGLMTNNHVLGLNHFENNFEFKIIFKSIDTEYTVKINEMCFIFTCELIDVTFIQFQNPLIKKIHEENFLDCNIKNCKINDIIYSIQYPKGENLEFAHGYIEDINGFDYFHSSSTDEGSSGSPLLNNDLKVVGIHKAKRKSENVNVATRFNIIMYAICTLYNNMNLIGIEKAKQLPKILTEKEIEELVKHGLHETLSPQIFKIPKSNNSPELLFFRTNHAWYWMERPRKLIERDLNNINKLKKCKWSIIKSINENEDNIECYENINHRQKVIINFLKLTELSFLTDYQNY